MMKKITLLLMILILSLPTFAQEDVTKFLGIPVDGSKSTMIQKLRAKGYHYDTTNDCLTGEFNGSDVNIYIHTNNNKVWRIMVCDATTMDEGSIKIRFNNLCSQFKNNAKYMSFQDYTIPDDENISYEMLVHSKKYDAIFFQNLSSSIDTASVRNHIISSLLTKYSKEELSRGLTDEQKKEAVQSFVGDMIEKKLVWFRIIKNELSYPNPYYIALFYENRYNMANGDDL